MTGGHLRRETTQFTVEPVLSGTVLGGGYQSPEIVSLNYCNFLFH